MLRDKLRNKKYYDEAIEFTDEYIEEEREYLQNTPAPKPLAAMKTSAGLIRLTLDRMEYCYSRGDSLANSKEDLINLLKYRELQKQYADQLPEKDSARRVEWEKLSFSTYKKVLTWLAFAISLDVNKEYLHKLLQLVDNSGLDALFDLIAVKLGDDNRTVAADVLHAKPYKLLIDAIEAKSSQQTLLMNRFLDSWYPACVKNGFYETHEITNNFGYRGYWCYEAALIVLVFGMDDSGFRDHRYYPADLAHTR